MRLICTLAATVFTFLMTSAQSVRLSDFKKEVTALIYSSEYDSALVMTLRFLRTDDLSPEEKFQGTHYYGETIRSSGRPRRAITAFRRCFDLIENLDKRELYESKIHGSIGACYFDIPNYKLARKHASKSVSLSPDTSLVSDGHATNYLILGFCDYREGLHNRSRNMYYKARDEYLKKGNKCDLPLYHTKMARLENTSGRRDLAMMHIDSSEQISEECDVQVYKILTVGTLYEIHRENRDFKTALDEFIKLGELNDKMKYDLQQAEMAALEMEYEDKIREVDIRRLEEIAEKNKLIAATQQTQLYIALIAIVFLLILAFLLFRTNNRRQRALKQVRELNTNLEKKVNERTLFLEKANAKAHKQSEALARQNRRLIDFYHMITHDIRAPLANMTMLIKLIVDNDDPGDQKQLVANLPPVVNSLNKTVGDLLEAIQLTPETEETVETVKFEDIFNEVKTGLKPQLNASEAVLKTDFSGAPEVSFPDKHLRSIMHNLLSNALKYRNPDRRPLIEVTTEKKNGSIRLRFSDNGLGIDLSKNGNRIFKLKEVFHQHPEAKGYGLYIVKSHVENFGGKIWVESEPGKGTTFFIEFPVRE